MNLTQNNGPLVLAPVRPAFLRRRPKETRSVPFQTPGEEIANAVIHGIGALLGIAGLVLLTRRSLSRDGLTAVYVIFASAMVLMFLASTLYHAMVPGRAKRIFRIFDHQAIYLFIAGTYTPFCLLGLKGPWGWSLFGLEWGLALTGMVLYAAGWGFIKRAELAIHILMGWAVLAGSVPLFRALPLKSLILLLAGGFAYTAGTFWYRAGSGKQTINEIVPRIVRGRRGAHVVWHVFVLAGALCHFFSVWSLV
ncbi:MAG: hemolysin III family protein [Treponema sp.]|jgi:hemolysin III|nr:hemolysin III family protein [Treponema sp.]